jgi:hypothetical protein
MGIIQQKYQSALALLLFTAAIGLNACGAPHSGGLTQDATSLNSISITPSNPNVALGEKAHFEATGSFSDGKQKDLTQTVAWKTSQAGVAEISAPGLATSKQIGRTTITAVSGDVTASTTLTVSPAALLSLAVSPANPIVPKGETQQLTAMGTFSDGSTQDMTAAVAWSSTPSGVVSISSTGVATAQAVGTSTLVATAASISGQGTLTVSQAALISISVSPLDPVVPRGETQQLTATGTFSDGTAQNLTNSVAWTSTPSGVVSISSTGLATAQAIGTSTLVATSGSITGKDTLTVAQAALLSLAIAPENATVPKGESQQLTAIGNFSDGSTHNLTRAVSWTALPPGVARVNSSGLLVAQNRGTTVVSASAGGISASDSVEIVAPVVISIGVSPANVSMPLGFQQQQFSATGTLSDGTQQVITDMVDWIADPLEVASIDSSALATTARVGTATIKATSGSVVGSATLNVTSPIMFDVNYFTNANTTGVPDASVNLSNTNATGNDLCAMVYVFDQNEAMTECCGCPVSANDLRTLSLNKDLTGNPLNGRQSSRGLIKIVPGELISNPTCDPTAVTGNGELAAWSVHLQSPTAVTESAFRPLLLTHTEETFLQGTCAAIKELGSGQGTCSCGSGH